MTKRVWSQRPDRRSHRGHRADAYGGMAQHEARLNHAAGAWLTR